MIDSPIYIKKPKNLLQWLKRKFKKPSVNEFFGIEAIGIDRYRVIALNRDPRQAKNYAFMTLHEIVRRFDQVPRTIYVTPMNMPAEIQGQTYTGVYIDEAAY